MSEQAEREALCRYSVLLEGDEPSDEAEKFDLILVRYSIFLYSTNAEDSWLMLARILARLAPLGVLVRVRVRVRVTSNSNPNPNPNSNPNPNPNPAF